MSSNRLALIALVCALFLAAEARAAAVTHGVTNNVTTNAATYTTSAFTTTANDLLVVFAAVTGETSTDWAVSDNASGTYTKIRRETKNGSLDILEVWVGNQLDAGSASRTVTYSHAAGNATGNIIFVARVSGMTRTGASAVLQNGGQSNQASGGTPTVTFGANVQTGNPTLGMVLNQTNPATLTPPTNWTEQADVGYGLPTTGGEYVSRDSGFTGTTITWGATSGSGFGDLGVELDTTAPPAVGCSNFIATLGAGCK